MLLREILPGEGARRDRHRRRPADRQERRRPVPAARHGQPARPGGRRHGHRQDGDPAGAGRGVQPRRRARLRRRHQGRPLGHHPAGRGQRQGRRPRRAARPLPLAVRRLAGDVLGRVRRAGPPRAHHRVRGRAAAARAHAQPQRHPGGRAHGRLPRRRRQRPPAARPRRPALHPQVRRRQRGRDRHHLRQRLRRLRRRHPACAAHAGGAGRAEVLRRARPRPLRLHADRRPGPRLRQHPRRGQAHDGAQGLLHPAALAAQRALRAAARGRRPAQAQAGLLLRRGAPAVHRRARRRCSPRSSRWCA